MGMKKRALCALGLLLALALGLLLACRALEAPPEPGAPDRAELGYTGARYGSVSMTPITQPERLEALCAALSDFFAELQTRAQSLGYAKTESFHLQLFRDGTYYLGVYIYEKRYVLIAQPGEPDRVYTCQAQPLESLLQAWFYTQDFCENASPNWLSYRNQADLSVRLETSGGWTQTLQRPEELLECYRQATAAAQLTFTPPGEGGVWYDLRFASGAFALLHLRLTQSGGAFYLIKEPESAEPLYFTLPEEQARALLAFFQEASLSGEAFFAPFRGGAEGLFMVFPAALDRFGAVELL